MMQAVWSTAHGAPAVGDDLQRRADLAPRRARRPDPRRCSRRSGGSGRAPSCCSSCRRSRSRSARCRSSGSRASTSARSRRRSASRSRTCSTRRRSGSTLSEFHPVALACPLLLFAIWFLDEERLSSFAAAARRSRRSRRRRRSGSSSRRSGSGTPSRTGAPRAGAAIAVAVAATVARTARGASPSCRHFAPAGELRRFESRYRPEPSLGARRARRRLPRRPAAAARAAAARRAARAARRRCPRSR